MTVYKVGCVTDTGEVHGIGVLHVDAIPAMPGYDSLTLAEDYTACLMRGEDVEGTTNVTGIIREDVDKFFGLVWFLTNEQGQPLAFLADIDNPGSDMPPCGHGRLEA